MNTEILIALIGAFSTLTAALVSNWEILRKQDKTTSAKTGKIIIFGSFLFGVFLVSLTWFYYSTRTKHLTMKGLFKDRAPNQEVYLAQEDIDLDIDNNGVVSGKSSASVKQPNGTFEKKSWLLRGFLHGEMLVLSYISDDTIPDGMGTYVLKLDRQFYLGHETIKDRTGIYITPYAATFNADAITQSNYWTPDQIQNWQFELFPSHFERDVLKLDL
ncbi:hypothetical protein [Leptospira yasudae]|uniref:hypothetical protein n=1 Tax=Leptospira yasudae TaxID=2202201 RepID=UPI0010915E91|nr:hypothetical protein [Leptospira yasudae]MBW0436024.1 hypothetical protein [Leptospira yasudae]TGM99925.1 hypothetical protein EHR10_08675 [Leptospira yasudae]